jgi:hypothetical protein
MSSRVTFSLALGLVLLASLWLKLSRDIDGGSPAESSIAMRVTNLLERHGLEVSPGAADGTQIVGKAGACRIVITEVAPQGWQRSVTGQTAGDGNLSYIFDGRVYSDQPVMRTRADYYWRRLQRYLGLDAPDKPVFAVVTTPACPEWPLHDIAALTALM